MVVRISPSFEAIRIYWSGWPQLDLELIDHHAVFKSHISTSILSLQSVKMVVMYNVFGRQVGSHWVRSRRHLLRHPFDKNILTPREPHI